MPNRIGPSMPGARAAREFVRRVERMNEEAQAKGESVSPLEIAKVAEVYLASPELRRGYILAMAEFVAEAIAGNVIKSSTWTPLNGSDPLEHPSPIVKRF